MCLRVHGRAPVIAHGPVIIQGLDRRRLSRSGVGLRVGIADMFPEDAGDAGASGSRPPLQLSSLEKGPSTVTLLPDPADAFCNISLSSFSRKTSLPRVPRRPSSGPPWLLLSLLFAAIGTVLPGLGLLLRLSFFHLVCRSCFLPLAVPTLIRFVSVTCCRVTN